MKGDPELVDRTFRKLRFRGVSVYWILLPAVIPIAITVAATVVDGALSPEGDMVILRPGPRTELGWALFLVIPFSFAMGMIGSPLGEEPGWRGYIFDRLATGGHGVWGSILVAVMWWIWHVPLFIALDVPLNGYSLLELAGHSLLIDSVFLFSGRNLLVAMLYHQGVNTSFMFFASNTQTVHGLIILLGVAVGARAVAETNATWNRSGTESNQRAR
jgi:membrane protease YdiL (CAAX protease family)